MATSSFDREFVVKDKEVSDRVRQELDMKHIIKVKKCDLDKESKKGIKLLKGLLSV